MIWRIQKRTYVCKIGNYLRVKIKREDETQWGMYAALKRWKQDGAGETKVGEYERIATLQANNYRQALMAAEERIKEIIKDQAEAAGMKVQRGMQ